MTATITALEPRRLFSVFVTVNYQFDTQGFFDTQAKKDLLESAVDMIVSRFNDTLDAINPGGGNSWTASFPHPGTGALQSIPNLQVDADEYVIYAGGRQLGGTLGIGGPGAFNASGSQGWLDTLSTRGEAGVENDTDFARWGGAITFDIDANWHFDDSIDDLDDDEDDFLSVALHELAHAFGFGTADSWEALATEDGFLGAHATEEYDGAGNPPLNDALSHWAPNTEDNGQEAAMDPEVLRGTRKLMTELDFAALDDIGWELDGADIEPPVVSIEATDKTARERKRNKGTFTVTRTGNTSEALRVRFLKTGSTATVEKDYDKIGKSVLIPAGETSANIRIKPVNDKKVEGQEFVRLTIRANDDYEIDDDDKRARVNIVDNDVAAAFAPLVAHRSVPSVFADISNTRPADDDVDDLLDDEG